MQLFQNSQCFDKAIGLGRCINFTPKVVSLKVGKCLDKHLANHMCVSQFLIVSQLPALVDYLADLCFDFLLPMLSQKPMKATTQPVSTKD
jgi:hypothetical protein